MERKENRLPIFTQRFRELQGERSNTDFADFLGLSRQTVGFYCNSDRLPDVITLIQIAEKCNVSTDYLLGVTDIETRDVSVREICEKTGLSEKAYEWLEELNLEPSIKPHALFGLNKLLEDPFFEDLCIHISTWAAEYKLARNEEETSPPIGGDEYRASINLMHDLSDIVQRKSNGALLVVTRANWLDIVRAHIENEFSTALDDIGQVNAN